MRKEAQGTKFGPGPGGFKCSCCRDFSTKEAKKLTSRYIRRTQKVLLSTERQS